MKEEIENKRKSPKRLVVDISMNLHIDIKSSAAKRNISMKTWVLRAINQALLQEKKYE